MVTIQGLYNTAICYTPELEEAARNQTQAVCDQAEFADAGRVLNGLGQW